MLLTDGLTGSYPAFIQESIGGGSYDNYPAIDEALTQKNPNLPLRLGSVLQDRDGVLYTYLRATSAFTRGQVATYSANVTGTVSTADATGDNIHVIKTNITGITTKNQEIGNWLVFKAADFATVRRRIKANTATSGGSTYFTISVKDVKFGRGGYDADAPAAAIAGTSVVHIFRPYHVAPCGLNGTGVGVANSAITSGNCGLFVVSGFCLILSDGSADAITDNGPMLTIAAGQVKGPGTFVVANMPAVIGVSKMSSNAAGALVPGVVSMLGRI
jgi:hypothetical protein